MRRTSLVAGIGAIVFCAVMSASGQAPTPAVSAAPDPVQALVSRLDLEKYKATIKGLAQFGDRRQGTKRNRDAIDWIEAQLKSYGCTNTERITYMHPSPEAADPNAPARGRGAGQAGQAAQPTGQAAQAARGQTPPAQGQQAQGARGQGAQPPTTPAQGQQAAAGAAPAGAGQGRQGGQAAGPLPAPVRGREGGSTLFGNRGRRSGNTDAYPQPSDALRALNAEASVPGERQEVYCTKIGASRPDEMYIIGGHMDGIGGGEAANDDASGSAIVMELARIFSSPDVTTERSIRFILWNNEESGLNGAWAYVNQRKALQGKESPAGSGRYPEPNWVGMIQHDMMMWDHGMPRADGTLNPEQRPEADVNIEFQSDSKVAEASMKLAFALKAASDKYATDYPASVGPHMTNTDSRPFQDLIPSVSLRENERGMQTGVGWNPHWHQTTDLYATFSDKDFKLGLNAAQTTLGGLAALVGAKVK